MNVEILGIGTDIVKIKRFYDINLENNSKILEKIFTKKEIEYCFTKSNPSQHLAVRFAGKEAVIKALNYIYPESFIDYHNIEIIIDEYKRPIVNIKSHKLKMKKIHIHISLSHSEDNGIAFVIISSLEEINK